jgi:hypothetical protein
VVDGGSKVLTSQKPLPQHWTNYSIGRSGFHITAIVHTQKNRLQVCLTINHRTHAKAFFRLLQEQKADIEAEIGAPLLWLELPNHKESRIELWRENTDPWKRSDWPQQHAWLLQQLENFQRTFAPRVRTISSANPQASEVAENLAPVEVNGGSTSLLNGG